MSYIIFRCSFTYPNYPSLPITTSNVVVVDTEPKMNLDATISLKNASESHSVVYKVNCVKLDNRSKLFTFSLVHILTGTSIMKLHTDLCIVLIDDNY